MKNTIKFYLWLMAATALVLFSTTSCSSTHHATNAPDVDGPETSTTRTRNPPIADGGTNTPAAEARAAYVYVMADKHGKVVSPPGLSLPNATTATNALGFVGVVATNGQVLNQATNYWVAANVSVSIFLTNGGTMNVFGDGTITSNKLWMGSVANIKCRYYCPNGGNTLFNQYSNLWQSVTCRVDCIEADISDVLNNQFNRRGLGEESENTTNQSSLFIVNATQRINFWEWETKRYDSIRFAEFTTCLIYWTTHYFDATRVKYGGGPPLQVHTLNCVDGSYLQANIFDLGGLPDGLLLQLWNNVPYTNIFFTFDVANLIGTNFFQGIQLCLQVSTNTTLSGASPTTLDAINLPRIVNDSDGLVAGGINGDHSGSIYNWGGTQILGQFYEPLVDGVLTNQIISRVGVMAHP